MKAGAAADPLLSRLQRFGPLPPDAVSELQSLTRNSHARPAGHPLFEEGKRSDHVCVLTDGIACRYRMLSGGRRQILGYILPGDLCDVQFIAVGAPDHSVSMLTEGAVARIAIGRMMQVLTTLPAIRHALEMAALIEKAILRQWLLNIAQGSAIERLSHFLCEFLARMQDIGRVDSNGSVPFGINQLALADTLGMSTVHVNRTLQALRAADMIVLRKRHLHVLNRDGLAAMAGFDPAYLELREDVR